MLTFDLLLPLKKIISGPFTSMFMCSTRYLLSAVVSKRYKHFCYSYAGVVVAVIHVDVASCPFSDW